MRSMPSCSTTRLARRQEEELHAPEPVPTSQQVTKTATYAVLINVSGATNSPKRCSHGTNAKITPVKRLTTWMG